MDTMLARISRDYARRRGRRDLREAREDLLDLYEHYKGGELRVPEHRPGRVDRGMAGGAAFLARALATALRLGPLKYPAALLARQGVQRAREATWLANWVRADRRALQRLVKPKKATWQL